MPLPLDQWQFYVVTVVALGGVYVLLRPFLRRGSAAGGGTGCSGCGSGSTSRKRAVPLTIGGRRR